MDGFEYEIALKDSLSGPTNRARDSLGRFVSAAQRADVTIDKLGRAHDALGRFVGSSQKAIVGATGAMSVFAQAAHKAHGGAHAIASGISYAVRGFDDLSRGGRYAANGVLDVGKAFARLGPWLVGAAVLGGTAALAKYAFEVSEVREQTIAAYDAFQGEGKGAKTFALIDDLAQSVHAPGEKVQGLAKELLELGLTNQTQLAQTVRAVTDLQRVGLESGARKIEALIERSLAAGHLVLGKGGAGASRALTGTGISEADLAAQLGLSPKQLEASLKAGKITVEEGLAAIDQAIIQGKVGALATKKFTVSDAFTDLHNSVRRLFQESDDSPITEAMRRLTQNFADGTEGARQLQDAVDLIFKGLGGAIDLANDLGSAFAKAADTAFDAWDKTVDAITRINPLLSDEEKRQAIARRHVDRHAQLLGQAVESQQAAFEKVQNLAQSGAPKAEILSTAKRLGIDVSVLDPSKGKPHTREPTSLSRNVPGLEVGTVDIDAKGRVGAEHPERFHEVIAPLKKLGQDAGNALVEGAAGPQGLDAHSPSKRMFDLGVDAADGLQDGASTGSAQGRTTGEGRSVLVHVEVGGIHMAGSIDADEFAPLLESQVADVFERVALELGA